MDTSIPRNERRTYKSRTDIGFQERESWRHAPALIGTRELKIQGHPVMEDWEDGYMRVLASIATSRGGTVLEVGFGLGISARHIQNADIDTHIIIEANEDVFSELVKMSQEYVNIFPILGFWEEVTSRLPSGSIDGILFDTYPLSEREIHQNHFPFFPEAHRLLRPGGVLTYYSDESDSYSLEHREALLKSGFTKIDQFICPVEPPSDCQYWDKKTLLAPIIER